ncbi:MAG: hypothetical protein KQH83_09565 [Actinobacteria bacterium]|nr:hypothetical protein [Actinomycetota bacterium]
MSLSERIGGYRRYVLAVTVIVVGAILAVWPGGIGGDDTNSFFVSLGSMLAVGGVAWLFLRLDRQVSDDPRYQRPVYREDDEA